MTWNLFRVKGLREEVKTRVSAANIPEAAKGFINSEIDSLPADIRAVAVDACGQKEKHPGSKALTCHTGVTVVGLDF